jgi:hypothetical protein
MARNLSTETPLQGKALRSLGAPACLPGLSFRYERLPAGRGDAEHGEPGMRW